MLYIENLDKINSNVKSLSTNTNLIIVTKNQDKIVLSNLIKTNYIHYGENRVQEAFDKWTNLLSKKSDIKLHLIGRLQSNKAELAFNLFEYIHSLDSEKLANIFSNLENKHKKKLKYFIQVNIGDEPQKGGVKQSDVNNFVNYCKIKLNLDVIGLMCIPPEKLNPEIFFSKISIMNRSLGFTQLSMGMSQDYQLAIKYGSTFVRIGSKIFGDKIT